MTEKRFFQVGSFFIDTVKKEKTKDRNTIIGLLNELTEENQKLKKVIQAQKQIIDKQEMKLAEYNNQINVSTN